MLRDALSGRRCSGRALDLGCGQGTDLLFLAEMGFTVVGVDISFNALLEAERRLFLRGGEPGIPAPDNEAVRCREHEKARLSAPVMLAQADGTALPFRDASFSFVNDRGCFHHVPADLRLAFAGEAGRVTESGGIMILRSFGERYFEAGGAGIPLRRDDIIRSFSPGFTVGEIAEYTSFVDTIPVDMCLCTMTRR